MRLLANLSDSELVEHLHSGQENAFEILFCRYRKDVRHVVLHYVKDRTATEDLCQDAFIRIYTSLKKRKYNEQGTFLSWALRITRNLCMDHLRKAARFSRTDSFPHETDFCTTWSQSAEYLLAAKQQEQLIQGFLSQLPEDQQKVVYYRYFEEMSFAEIAALMNTSVNTSLGRMRYGLSRLRREVSNNLSVL